MKPLPVSALVTRFDRIFARAANWLRWSGFGLFLGILAFAAWVKVRGPLHGGWLTAALALCLASMALAMLSIVVDAIPNLVTIVRFRKVARRRLLLEIDHDLKHTQTLVTFERRLIEKTDKLLSIKIERLKGHIGLALGGADKIALFSLAGMGWAALQEIHQIGLGWRHDALIYGLAFMGGLAIGGVLLNDVIRRYSYQRDLLTLALERLE